MKRRLNKTTFNPYPQNQLMLSTILDGFIPEVNLVRVVDEVIEEMDIVPLLKQYKGGGSSSYLFEVDVENTGEWAHPKGLFIASDSKIHPRKHQQLRKTGG